MDWDERYHADAKNEIIYSELVGNDGSWRVVTRIIEDEDEDDRRVLVHGIVPAIIPEARRLPGAELLTRIKYSLSIGNFEMDMDRRSTSV